MKKWYYMFEEESQKKLYLFGALGVLAVVLFILLLVWLWPSGETIEAPGTYVGFCPDSFCDPVEKNSSSCPADCPVRVPVVSSPVTAEEDDASNEGPEDVRILDIDFVGIEDEDAEFAITLSNQGTERASNFAVTATLSAAHEEVDTCSSTISSLGVQDEKVVNCLFATGSVLEGLEGSVTVTVEVVVGEETLRQTFTWNRDMIASDLSVVDIDYDIIDNSTMEVTVTVTNSGGVAVEDAFTSDVVLFIDDDEHNSCSAIDTTVEEIPEGEEETFTCEIDLNDVDEMVLDDDVSFEIRVTLDSDDDIAESDEDNNDDTKSGTLEVSDFAAS